MSQEKTFWKIKLNMVKRALEKNNFKASIHDSLSDASKAMLEEIKDKSLAVKTVAFGGSVSIDKSGLLAEIPKVEGLKLISPFSKGMGKVLEMGRECLMADYYLASSNAISMDGKLLNVDKIGNRVCAINFGPTHVGLLVGRNKISPEVEDGLMRIKEYVAPMNSARLKYDTPCVKTATCMDCSTDERICNVWTITEKSYPAGRIHVFLVNEDLGL